MVARAKVTDRKRKSTARNSKSLAVETPSLSETPRRRFLSKQIIVIGLVICLVLLAIYKKHWFVAATINNSPITSIEVIARLYSDYRLPAVNEIIDERLIMEEAQRNNAVPSDVEILQRVSELETQVGGSENLNGLLAQEGTSRTSLERRMKLRLALEKIYSNEATVSAQERDEFVKTNKVQLTATESAAQQEEAEKIIRQQKLSTVINQKFSELRQKAEIKTF